MNLSIDSLEQIQESGGLTNELKSIVDILVAAVNDWPLPIDNLVDYEKDVIEFLGDSIDRKKIDDFILKIDYSKSAWQAESLSQLKELFDHFKGKIFLKEIFEEINERLANL